MVLLNSQKIIHGLLVKWLNTPPSQGGIHGFETRTDYHMKLTRSIPSFCFIKLKIWYNY